MSQENQRVMITGASGFLGNALLNDLLSRDGFDINAVVRSDGVKVSKNVRTSKVGDLGPKTDWSEALEGVDVVVHCAARVPVMDDRRCDLTFEFWEANVEGTLALARQAASAGVRRLVFVSSVKVNGEETLIGEPFRENDWPNPQDVYGRSKFEAEQGLLSVAEDSGLEVVILRPPLIYGAGVKGNFSSMINLMWKGYPLPLLKVRRNRRSLVSVDNLCDLIVRCFDHSAAANEVFFVADREVISTAELLEKLARAMGRPARLFPVPEWMLRTAARTLGKQHLAQRLLGSLEVDTGKAQELLGWSPPNTLDESLRRSVASFLTETRQASAR